MKQSIIALITTLVFGFAYAQNDSALIRVYEYKTLYRDSAESIKGYMFELGKTPTLFAYRGICYFNLEEYKLAIKDFKKAIKMNTNMRQLVETKYGVSLYKNRSFKKALEEFSSILSNDSNNYDANYYSALIYYKKRKFHAASNHLNRIYDEIISKRESYNEMKALAEVYYQSFEYKKALVIYTQLLKINVILEDQMFYYLRRGICNYKVGLYKEAEYDYNTVLSLNQDDQFALYLRAYDRYQLGKYEEALNDATRSVGLYNNGSEQEIRGFIYNKLEKTDSAIADFKYAIKKGNTPYSYTGLADVYIKLIRYQDAIDALDMCIKKHPTFAEAYYKKGICFHLKKESMTESCPLIKKGIQLGYKDADQNIIREICNDLPND